MEISLVALMVLAASMVFGAVDISGKWHAEFDTHLHFCYTLMERDFDLIFTRAYAEIAA